MEQAQRISEQSGYPLLTRSSSGNALELRIHSDCIELFDQSLNTSIIIDFLHGALAHRKQYGGGRGQALAKAVGLKSGVSPTVLDVTAGLATDAYVLASLGCSVTMIERSPVAHALIEDAIERAELNEDFQQLVKQGFTAVNMDANDYMEQRISVEGKTHDVVYIDPMYPHRKKSALVKKEMQILQRLHASDSDPQLNEERLLNTAMRYANHRVVVKRPAFADPLCQKKPNTQISSKKTRYDIYTIKKM